MRAAFQPQALPGDDDGDLYASASTPEEGCALIEQRKDNARDEKAAVTIARHGKGFLARRLASRRKREAMDAEEQRKMDFAAVAIQSRARAFMAKKEVQCMIAERDAAVAEGDYADVFVGGRSTVSLRHTPALSLCHLSAPDEKAMESFLALPVTSISPPLSPRPAAAGGGLSAIRQARVSASTLRISLPLTRRKDDNGGTVDEEHEDVHEHEHEQEQEKAQGEQLPLSPVRGVRRPPSGRVAQALLEARAVARELTTKLDALCAPAPNVAPSYTLNDDGTLEPLYPDLSMFVRHDFTKMPALPRWREGGDVVDATPDPPKHAKPHAKPHASVRARN